MRARGAILEPLVGPTMCELNAGVRADFNATSLGLVRVREFKRIGIIPGKPWTTQQQAKIDVALSSGTLFGEPVPAELQAPRYEVRISYVCDSLDCKGH